MAIASFTRFSWTTNALNWGFFPLVILVAACAARPHSWGRLGLVTAGDGPGDAESMASMWAIGALPNCMFSVCNCCTCAMPSFVAALSANWWAARHLLAIASSCSDSVSAAGAIAGR